MSISNSSYKPQGLLTLQSEILDLEALVRATIAGHNRSIRDQRVVDTRIRHQVGLELGQINVEGTIEAQAGSDGADDLGDETVEVLVAGARNVQVAMADVVDGLIVNQESAVSVLNSAVGGQNGVVGLNNCSRHAGRRVDRELEFGLLAILAGETLQQQSAEARASTATEGVEYQKALQARAVFWNPLSAC